MRISCMAVVSAIFCISCAGASPAKDLRPIVAKRAAFELSCSADQLQIIEFSHTSSMAGTEKTFGVEGCGKRASYRAWCTTPSAMGGSTCDAVQASAPTVSSAPASAPPSGAPTTSPAPAAPPPP